MQPEPLGKHEPAKHGAAERVQGPAYLAIRSHRLVVLFASILLRVRDGETTETSSGLSPARRMHWRCSVRTPPLAASVQSGYRAAILDMRVRSGAGWWASVASPAHAKDVGWAKRSVPTNLALAWARRIRAFAHASSSCGVD